MANRSQAEFVRQMLRLRAKHQNRLPHELIEQAGQVLKYFGTDVHFSEKINSEINKGWKPSGETAKNLRRAMVQFVQFSAYSGISRKILKWL